MKKILFVTNRLPFPETDGRKKILLQYIKTLKKVFISAEIFNISYVDNMDDLRQRPEEISELITLEKPNIVEKIFNIAFYTILLRKYPIQVSLFYRRKNKEKINNLVEKINPDIIIYDMVRVAEYVSTNNNVIKVMNYDDLLSLRYKRQMDWIQYIPSIFGGFKMPQFLNQLFNLKRIQLAVLEFESKLLEGYETRVAKRFDHLLFTSPNEAALFKELTGHSSCRGIPMTFERNLKEINNTFSRSKIVFVGKMDIPHNVSAVLYFYNNIFPVLKKKIPELEFHIVGKCPVDSVKKLSSVEGIIVTGMKENLYEYIKDSSLVVAPLVFGTGIKTKIIEALSLGLPVVTTVIGAEGIPVTDNSGIFVADNDQEFIEYIEKLVNSKEYNLIARKEAYDFFCNNYTEATNLVKWNEFLKFP